MTPPTCERCNGTGEPTEDPGEWLCPRCGIWIAIDGAELGPSISFEQARERYGAFAIKTAARIVEEAKRLGISPPEPPTVENVRQDPARLTAYDGFQMEHEDGWIYEYTAGEKPRRVRRTTSATEKK